MSPSQRPFTGIPTVWGYAVDGGIYVSVFEPALSIAQYENPIGIGDPFRIADPTDVTNGTSSTGAAVNASSSLRFDSAAFMQFSGFPDWLAQRENAEAVINIDIQGGDPVRYNFLLATRKPFLEMQPYMLVLLTAGLLRLRAQNIPARLVPGFCPHSAVPPYDLPKDYEGVVTEAIRRDTQSLPGYHVTTNPQSGPLVEFTPDPNGGYSKEELSLLTNVPMMLALIVSFFITLVLALIFLVVAYFAVGFGQTQYRDMMAKVRTIHRLVGGRIVVSLFTLCPLCHAATVIWPTCLLSCASICSAF